ncbi:unnamed protein product [Echinostoma caproni]|uniref:RRM domain-containing protein n=1 Tax=Echinostoma caproni TaxID=27848 RepID=A0A183AZF9_9TREM|nr:unnamed protein product [Echinostoma caproni]
MTMQVCSNISRTDVSQSNTDNCRELIFKHFPSELTDKECCDFLSGLGAISTRVPSLSDSRQKYIVAEFPSVEYAWNIIRSLHQRPIVDKRLSVEFYQSRNDEWQKVFTKSDSTGQVGVTGHQPYSGKTVMAPKWDPSFPVPPNLTYIYPSPTNSILTNICRCMISCPSFYTQVLHLMNRLHLPPPFCDTDTFPGNLLVVTESDLTSQLKTSDQKITEPIETGNKQDNHDSLMRSPVGDEQEEMDLSTSTESEIDSDDAQATHSPKLRMPKPVRRAHARLRPSGSGSHKRIRQTDTDSRGSNHLSVPTTESRLTPAVSDVFEPVSQTSKLELHIPSKLPSKQRSTARHTGNVESGFGIMPVHRKPTATTSETADVTKVEQTVVHHLCDIEFQLRKDHPENIPQPEKVAGSASSSETEDNILESEGDSVVSLSMNDLRLGRLTEEERQNYPVFAKGYQPGEPTSRLYIKNLAPRTTPEDLYRVFGAFQFGPVRDLNARPPVRFTDTARFSIRLLTEGRMKGQAFVSLPCELTALQALEATNGFLLHERPMVVHFARGAKAKVDEKSLIEVT